MTDHLPPATLFSDSDHRQMAALGLPPAEIARQVEIFRHPPVPTPLLRPARLGDGIRGLSEAEKPRLRGLGREAAARGRTSRFVPASGAASRMFQDLSAFLNEGQDGPRVRSFFENLERFAFAESLAPGDPQQVLSSLLASSGLGYAERPKGLLLFHRYPEGPRTPFEEHLVEAARTSRSADGRARLHFTVSPQHEAGFRQLLEQAGTRLGAALDTRFEVGFSHQAPATDTLAVDPENRPFRQADGSLLFRPGGHGALLGNLAAWARDGGDLVLLKNIDNVVTDAAKPQVDEWNRLLFGLLADLTGHANALLAKLDWRGPRPDLLEEGERFLREELFFTFPAGAPGTPPLSPEQRAARLADRLDRPFRVAGMVPNTGEPGGGPFWVRSSDGEVSLQIVEASQIDRESPEQQAHLAASTHFNPVHLVCGLRDRHGRPHDLEAHVDPAAVFLAEKSHDGRPLKAFERPGLWNGAMAGWNTVFVEVPGATFAPVKTVLDLLRPEHQG